MVWNYQNADCSLKNKVIVLFIIIFGTVSFPIHRRQPFHRRGTNRHTIVAYRSTSYSREEITMSRSRWRMRKGVHDTIYSNDEYVCCLMWCHQSLFHTKSSLTFAHKGGRVIERKGFVSGAVAWSSKVQQFFVEYKLRFCIGMRHASLFCWMNVLNSVCSKMWTRWH